MGFIYGINANCQGDLPNNYFLASWLSDKSDHCHGDHSERSPRASAQSNLRLAIMAPFCAPN